jgi:hypothetical protein
MGASPTFPCRPIAWTSGLVLLTLSCFATAAEVESRVLTHYLEQDYLETAVRTEGWTEVTLKVAGGLRKGDVVRVWSGGLIDRGNGEQPGANVNSPAGLGTPLAGTERIPFALSAEALNAFALLFKTESGKLHRCLPAGQPLEIKLTKDNEKVFVGFNDERGRYLDNHLGKGRRHELDPLWVRVEVVRIVVD